MSKVLSGKTALVTGASRGIGAAIARRLAADGALVAVHYGRSREAADAVVADIAAAGGDAFAVSAALEQPAEIERLFATLDAELTRRRGSTTLDILVSNAGVVEFAGFADTTEASFDHLFGVNVKASFLVTQQAARRMPSGGRIIELSSVVTRAHFPSALAYSMTKGAIDVFVRHLAVELGPRGITVNAIAPGVIETDMSSGFLGTAEGRAMVHSIQALQRIAAPVEIANVAAFLAGPDGGWTTGQVVDASGGTRL